MLLIPWYILSSKSNILLCLSILRDPLNAILLSKNNQNKQGYNPPVKISVSMAVISDYSIHDLIPNDGYSPKVKLIPYRTDD